MSNKLILEITEYDGVQQAFINGLRISQNKPIGESKMIFKIDLDHDYLLQALESALKGKITIGVKNKIL